MSAEEKVDILKELLDYASEYMRREERNLREYSINHRRTPRGQWTLYLFGKDHCYIFFYNPQIKKFGSIFEKEKYGSSLSEKLHTATRLFFEPECPVSRGDFVNEPSDVTNDPQGPLFKEDYRKEY